MYSLHARHCTQIQNTTNIRTLLDLSNGCRCESSQHWFLLNTILLCRNLITHKLDIAKHFMLGKCSLLLFLCRQLITTNKYYSKKRSGLVDRDRSMDIHVNQQQPVLTLPCQIWLHISLVHTQIQVKDTKQVHIYMYFQYTLSNLKTHKCT